MGGRVMLVLRSRLVGQGAVLAALAVCAAGLLGFALLIGLASGEPRRFDTVVLLALRRPDGTPIGPPWLALMMRDLTALGGMAVLGLAGLVALGALALRRRWRAVWLLLLSLPGAMLLNTLLKQHFDRPRPDLVTRLAEVATSSFPSGHAMLSAVGYLTLGALLAVAAERRRDRGYILGVAVVLTLLVGFSRVFLGVHWPSDVLAGWCLGAAWAMGCWLLLRAWPRSEREPPRPEA
jgi:undecaprenyl-diphosphatase